MKSLQTTRATTNVPLGCYQGEPWDRLRSTTTDSLSRKANAIGFLLDGQHSHAIAQFDGKLASEKIVPNVGNPIHLRSV